MNIVKLIIGKNIIVFRYIFKIVKNIIKLNKGLIKKSGKDL